LACCSLRGWHRVASFRPSVVAPPARSGHRRWVLESMVVSPPAVVPRPRNKADSLHPQGPSEHQRSEGLPQGEVCPQSRKEEERERGRTPTYAPLVAGPAVNRMAAAERCAVEGGGRHRPGRPMGPLGLLGRGTPGTNRTGTCGHGTTGTTGTAGTWDPWDASPPHQPLSNAVASDLGTWRSHVGTWRSHVRTASPADVPCGPDGPEVPASSPVLPCRPPPHHRPPRPGGPSRLPASSAAVQRGRKRPADVAQPPADVAQPRGDVAQPRADRLTSRCPMWPRWPRGPRLFPRATLPTSSAPPSPASQRSQPLPLHTSKLSLSFP
jgi:hypothetical protein